MNTDVPACGMHLYTLILDYAGGTYVAQTEASDEKAALSDWIGKLSSHRIAGAISEEVAVALGGSPDDPVCLDGLTGVWCASTTAGQGLALVNVVRTAT